MMVCAANDCITGMDVRKAFAIAHLILKRTLISRLILKHQYSQDVTEARETCEEKKVAGEDTMAQCVEVEKRNGGQ